MYPKVDKKKQVQKKTDEEQLEDSLKQLYAYLSRELSKKGKIESKLEKTIRDIWETSDLHVLKDDFISELHDIIVAGGRKYCNRLSESMFSLLLHIALRADGGLAEAQRIIYILANSLQYTRASQEDNLERRNRIAEYDFYALITYFTNMEIEGLMRRWVGLLLAILLRGSEHNLRMLEDCPEAVCRQGIGRLIIHETDDFIKTVAGRFIAIANEAGMDFTALWPNDVDAGLYQTFPPLTKFPGGWTEKFVDWLHHLNMQFPGPERLGQMAFVDTLRYRDHSTRRGGVEFIHQNVVAFISEDMVSFLIPSLNTEVDQIIDIVPISSFESVTVSREQVSQVNLKQMEMTFHLKSDDFTQKFLNGRQMNVEKTSVLASLDWCGRMIAQFSKSNPSLEILGYGPEFAKSRIRGRALSSDEIHTEKGSQGLVASTEKPIQTPESRDDSASSESGPSQVKANARDVAEREKELELNEAEGKQRTRSAVKPKAKPPIVQSHEQADENNKATQKRTQLPSARPAAKTGTTYAITTGDTDELPAPENIQPKSIPDQQSNAIARKALPQQNSTVGAGRSLAKNALPKSKSIAAKTGRGKATLAASSKPRVVGTASKPKKFDGENDDYITSPDIHDASTPKVVASRATTSKDVNQGQKKRYSLHRPEISGTSNVQDQQKQNKRYSLNRKPEPAGVQNLTTDVFDMPTDDEENENMKTAKTGTKPKTKAKGRASTGQIEKKKASKASTAANAKKRQSAPAALDNAITAPRSSQRAAAARAKVNLREVDDIEDDDAMEIDDAVQNSLQSKVIRANKNSPQTKTKDIEDEDEVDVVEHDLPHPKYGISSQQIVNSATVGASKAQQDIPPPQATSEFIVVEMPQNEQLGAKEDLYHDHNDEVTIQQPEVDEEIERLQQEDARQLGLSQQDSPLLNFEDNLNDDPPEQIPEELPPKPQPIIATKSQNSAKNVSSKESYADKLNEKLAKVSNVEEVVVSRHSLAAPKDKKNSQPEASQPATRFVPRGTKNSQFEVVKPLMQPVPQIKKEKSQPPIQEPIFISSPSDQSDSIEYIHRMASQPVDQVEPASGKDKPVAERNPVPHVENTQKDTPSEVVSSSEENTTSSPGAPAKINSSTLPTEMVAEVISEKIITQVETLKVTMAGKISSKRPELPIKSVAPVDEAARQVAEPTTSRSPPQVDSKPDADIQQVADTNLFENESKSKRKADTLENVASKKPRKSDPQTFELQDTRTLEKVAHASKKLQPSAVPASKPALHEVTPNNTTFPSRTAPQALREATTEVQSVGKDPFRKPIIIAFNRDGPLNQGQPAFDKSSAFKDARVIKRQDSQERKRKRDHRVAPDPASPPNKRQESSPICPSDDYEEDEPMYDSSPVIIATTRLASTRSRSNRQSSQPSRVDRNGSPVANEKVDHIGKLKERLSQEAIRDKANDQENTVFGPKVRLGAKPSKVQKSSPEEVTSRYIAHERTRNGQYKEVGSKEVVAPESVLVDPFLDKSRKMSKCSDFTERLRKGASAAHEDSNDAARISQNDRHHLAVKPPQPLRGDAREERFAGANQRRTSIRPRHGVEDSGHHHERSPNSDLTGSSRDSGNSGVSGEAEDSRALKQVWNMAIRPHYSNAQHAIHTIAEEVITRLSDEEERMHRIVGQYNENGTKILNKLEESRKNEKQKLLKEIEVKSKELVSVYADAKEYIQEQVEELKENPIAEFSKGWANKQKDIQSIISAGMAAVQL